MTDTPETPQTPFEEQLKSSLSHAYDIERELGGGGMSRVFVATDKLLGRKIVIKLLSPDLVESVNRARFRREIQVAAQLQHPHIVTLLSAGEDGSLVYYTMPFIEGESLKSAVEQKGPLPVRDVIRVLYDVVDALSYAHARGVVHRDIKPANILRSGNHSLVTDFGVAKALNAAMSSSPMTSTGMAIGTPAYMAPEQLAGDPTADHRIDIYAVGLLAYELLAGKSPFWAATPQAQMAALLTLDPKPLHEIRKDVPKKMSMVVMQCLEKDPNDRPPTADVLLAMMDGIATTSGEIRTREHKVPTKKVPVAAAFPALAPTLAQAVQAAPAAPAPAAAPTYLDAEPRKSRTGLLVGALALLLILSTGAIIMSQRSGKTTTVATVEPPKPALAAPAPAAGAATAPVAPPVMTRVDSMAIAAAVQKALAKAATETKKPGAAAVNTDSLRQALQKAATDSIARVKAAELAAAAAAAPVAPTAPAVPAGKHKLVIAEPKESAESPDLNGFTKAFMDALRAEMSKKEWYALVDQDEVRGVLARTGSRDEAAKVLDPEAMVTIGYDGTGEIVGITVAVRDMRSSSSYGMRFTSTKVMPSKPEFYVDKIVATVVRQLDALAATPTFKPRNSR